MNDPMASPPLILDRGGMTDATRAATSSPISDRSGVTDAVRVQILATEHWGLLATRSMTWNESFSRASTYITLLSASIVALAFVAQATHFGPAFHTLALLALPIVFLMGVVNFVRMGDANVDDFHMVAGMNRLRRAYLELAPELEPYFSTESHDDELSISKQRGHGAHVDFARILASMPAFIGMVSVVVFGVFAALVAQSMGVGDSLVTVVGIVGAMAALVGFFIQGYATISAEHRTHRPIFPR